LPNGGIGRACRTLRGLRTPAYLLQLLPQPALPEVSGCVAEEATEVVIEAVRGRRTAVVMESVDLIYNLVVLWSELGITASEVWAEMDRRQALLGLAEKLPKDGDVEDSMSIAGQ
jgi:phosphoribosyl-ATP pyrophosphohydrolase